MIQRVYEGAKKAKLLERLIVATDDERISEACKKIPAEVWMTSVHHSSGTERVAEIATKIDSPLIINIQGDEPLIEGKMIDELVMALQEESIPVATLATKVHDTSQIEDKNRVKVIIDKNGFALYFSRAPIPYQASDYFLQHLGIYGFQKNFLLQIIHLPPSRLEKTENLEQLRILENGYKIKVIETPHPTLSVDSPEDIIKVEEYLKKKENG